ncbi:hypothetical protein IMSHALPRED_008456 [Imshaugia aleurites]|uniref:Uncharacterized protein n=1 Tax=Imshaugia aleurites TaxID=172621 RepID=A0A8H3ENI2_9LECA|nr:hypothetical protein IMSHALPRED_008456 [Imshaugia aleurites]
MQLSSSPQIAKGQTQGLIKTIAAISQQSPLAFYKGFGPVFTGIIPKMGIRFLSFEYYKSMLADTRLANPSDGTLTDQGTFLAGLAAGITEAVTVVTTMEVLKVRLQGQKRKAGDAPKYRNAAHAAYVIVKDEGPKALFKGMSLTALRQATNVSGNPVLLRAKDNHLTLLAVNLTTYTKLNHLLHDWQSIPKNQELSAFQTALCGLVAGAAGPMSNAPIDTLKTLVQRHPTPPGHSSLSHTVAIARTLFQQEGFKALYKGITPRVMRIAPGQAITYTIYEHLKAKLSG